MEPIGAYAKTSVALTLEQFCSRHPHPFLLHAQGAASLRPTHSTSVGTLERVVLTDGLGNRGDALAPGRLQKTLERVEGTREVADPRKPLSGSAELKTTPYLVFAVEAEGGEGADGRVSLGCSSRCDVQVNDESVSAVHAYISQRSEGYAILDNDSTTGTMVNDEVISRGEWRLLGSGDRVTVGYVDLIFLLPVEFYHFVERLFGR
jgi:hypothetical protein